MTEELFDIVFVRWLNFILVTVGIIYTHAVVRKLNSFWIGIPALVWLFQAFFFYLAYLLYYYGIIIIQSESFFATWTSFSKLLGLITMFLYLYYIEKTCWRGNGT
jgi:hypothetical protein